MDKYNELLEKCKEYVHLLWHTGSLNAFGMYGLTQMRMELHQEITELCKIDYEETKGITDNLPIDFSIEPNEKDIKTIAEQMANKLYKKISR